MLFWLFAGGQTAVRRGGVPSPDHAATPWACERPLELSQQQNYKSTLERAFEIADSGEVSSIDELGRLLGKEGYSVNMLTGPELLKQLRKRIAGQRPSG